MSACGRIESSNGGSELTPKRLQALDPAAAQARLGQDAREFLLESAGQKATAAANGGEVAMCTEDIIAENLEHRISQPTAEDTKNEDQNESVLILVRSWVAIALRRRSVDLLSKAVTLASQTGITLDELLVGSLAMDKTSGAAPVMSCVKDLLFKPMDEQDMFGEPLTAETIPIKLIKSHTLFRSGKTPESEIIFASMRTHQGLLSLYTSPKFDEEIVTKAEIETAYRTNSKPMLGLIFPPEEMQKVSRIVGVLFRSVSTKDTPPTVSIRTRAFKKGSPDLQPVSLYIGMLHTMSAPDEYTTYCIYKFVQEVESPQPPSNTSAQAAVSTSALTTLATSALMVSGQQKAAAAAAATTGGGVETKTSDSAKPASAIPVVDDMPHAFICVEGELQGTVGGELEPAAIPQQLFSSQLFQGGTSPQTEIVFAARRTHDGNVSLFTSAKFEKEVQPRSVIEIQCNSKKPILDLIFPPDEIGKVARTVNTLLKMPFETGVPLMMSVRTRYLQRLGGSLAIALYIGLIRIPTSDADGSLTFIIYRFAPSDQEDKSRAAVAQQGQPTPVARPEMNIGTMQMPSHGPYPGGSYPPGYGFYGPPPSHGGPAWSSAAESRSGMQGAPGGLHSGGMHGGAGGMAPLASGMPAHGHSGMGNAYGYPPMVYGGMPPMQSMPGVQMPQYGMPHMAVPPGHPSTGYGNPSAGAAARGTHVAASGWSQPSGPPGAMPPQRMSRSVQPSTTSSTASGPSNTPAFVSHPPPTTAEEDALSRQSKRPRLD